MLAYQLVPFTSKDSEFIKKAITKMCDHKNTSQSLFDKIQDLHFAYP